ncbi:hypothetical protein [Xanthomonas citri]|uniref:hypothetical protein n=1 Tax=Xanthomonas citri TaxID=346 RepID=UPI0009E867FE|nr:hypothetical protein [Xanthomonas citri]
MNNFLRFLMVEISNASKFDVVIEYGILTGGRWKVAPVHGAIIAANKKKSYINEAEGILTSLGGQIVLAPVNGGVISPSWSWPSGSPVYGGATNSATNLAVASQVINGQTNSPTMQIVIMDAVVISLGK